MEPPFVPGLVLAERLYHEHLAALLQSFDASLEYSAALIGYGSDVLGFDDETSIDHNWGPRGQIFLHQPAEGLIGALDEFLSQRLPLAVAGFSTHFSPRRVDGTQSMEAASVGPVRHLVQIVNAEGYFADALGRSPESVLTSADWLAVSEQSLLELTSGKVFHDGLGCLNRWRSALAVFPYDVATLRVALLWDAVGSEEAFLGRARARNDGWGLRLLAARQVSRLVKILFHCERRYIPYSKWFSTAARALAAWPLAEPLVERALEGPLVEVDQAVTELAALVLDRANGTGWLPVHPVTIRSYYGRPYPVVMASEVAQSYRSAFPNRELLNLDPTLWGRELLADGHDFTRS